MSEDMELGSRPTDRVGRVLYKISYYLAIFGGIVLCVVALLITISVTGRASISVSIPGDFELVAIGTSTAVFAVLPYCQITRGNVLVDFFMVKAPVRAKTFCDAVGGLLYLAIGALLTWRMIFGGIDLHKYGEKTITIGFPRWTTFPYSILCMTFLVIVVAYTLGRSVAETKANRYFDE